MRNISESTLFYLAKRFYSTTVGLNDEMRGSLESQASFDDHRARQIDRILTALDGFGIDLRDKAVLDLGCNNGAITRCYPQHQCRRVVGVDIDQGAIEFAQENHTQENVEFRLAEVDSIPLDDECIDVIISFDAFEHIEDPPKILAECRRVLRPQGQLLIGTWGWGHPLAPHLWSTVPVPWAHVFFSDRTLLRVARRVYNCSWYKPTMHDFDSCGRRIEQRYEHEEISRSYLNRFMIRDFERAFRESGMAWEIRCQGFRARYARWSRFLTRVPVLREYFTSFFWARLDK